MGTIELLRFAAVVTSGLVGGGFALVEFSGARAELAMSARSFIEAHQATDRFSGRYFPLTTAASLLSIGSLAVTLRSGTVVWILISGALLIATGALGISLTMLVPRNKLINAWNADAPPAEWRDVRAAWVGANHARAAFAVAGFALVAWAVACGG